MLLFNLSTRTSKTEFVCKSYGLSKFAVKTVQKLDRVGHGLKNRRKWAFRSVKTGDFEVDSDSAAAAGKVDMGWPDLLSELVAL